VCVWIGAAGRLLPAVAFLFFATPGFASQLTQFYVPSRAPVTLTFSAFNPARERIDERWFLENIAETLQAQSHQQFKSDGLSTEELTGLRTHLDQKQSQIIFQYVHLNRNKLGEEWGQTLTLPVSYRTERNSDFVTFSLQPPQMADFVTRPTPGVLFFVPSPKLRTIKELFADFAAILDQAHSLTLHYSFLFRGAENASSEPASCIGNFDRLLGRYGYARNEERRFDLTRDDVFSYRAGQNRLALKVAALPDGGGSQIFYEAWLPLELHADGTVKGYELAPTLEADIRLILNAHPALELNSALDKARRSGHERREK
jgi:hypothetical protein